MPIEIFFSGKATNFIEIWKIWLEVAERPIVVAIPVVIIVGLVVGDIESRSTRFIRSMNGTKCVFVELIAEGKLLRQTRIVISLTGWIAVEGERSVKSASLLFGVTSLRYITIEIAASSERIRTVSTKVKHFRIVVEVNTQIFSLTPEQCECKPVTRWKLNARRIFCCVPKSSTLICSKIAWSRRLEWISYEFL